MASTCRHSLANRFCARAPPLLPSGPSRALFSLSCRRRAGQRREQEEAAAGRPASGKPATRSTGGRAPAVRCLINEERDEANLKLTMQADQGRAAAHRDMYNHDCFAHQCPGEARGRPRPAGRVHGRDHELPGGRGDRAEPRKATPREVVRQWKNSPSHRSEILSSAYRHIGVGMVARNGKAYYTVTLGWKSG